jgi:NMD protein affecting ribosome stability and mRNA decay
MRNTCFRCGKPVGNITFTVCDDCKAESSKSKMTKIVKDETGNVYTHICENCGILFYDTNLWCDPNGKILCSNCAKDVKQAKYDIKAETLEKIIAKQTELIINLKTGFVNIIGGQLSCQEITRLETELKSLKKNK